MSNNIKGYLEDLISEYRSQAAQLEESVRAANQKYKKRLREQDLYTPKFMETERSRAVDQAAAAHKNKAAELNTRAKTHISSAKERLLSAITAVDKSGDYAVRVNNALQFVRIEGAAITDETAAQILSDFLGDVETMQRFRSVISHQKGEQLTDAYGKTTFPLTFGRLEKIEMFMGAFADLEATAEQLFIRKMSRTEEEHMPTGLTLYVPMDGLSQLMAERVIIDQANTVDVMADELTGGK